MTIIRIKIVMRQIWNTRLNPVPSPFTLEKIKTPRFNSETPSQPPAFCVRAGQGCFGQKSRRPGSIRKPPNAFGAAALPLKHPEGRLQLNPVPPHFIRKKAGTTTTCRPPLDPQVGTKNPPKWIGRFSKNRSFFVSFWDCVSVPFGAHLAPSCIKSLTNSWFHF